MSNKIPVHKNKSLDNLEGELWKEIPFTDGYYMVSNYGRVKALERLIVTENNPSGRWLKPKILSQSLNKMKNVYKGDITQLLSVTYTYEGISSKVMVGRLVYKAFIQPLTKVNMEDKYVYPLDGNRFNCRQANLGLATKSTLRSMDLQKDRYIPPTDILPKEFYTKQAIQFNKLKRRRIKRYSLDGQLEATYPSLTVAAKKNDVSIGCIGLCAQKKLVQLKGFVYRYADESYEGEYIDWQGKCKKIIQFNYDGTQVKTFPSINEAARNFGISNWDISRSAKKITKQAGGFVWRYEGDNYQGEYKEQLTKKKFIQCYPDGEVIAIYEDIAVAAKETNSTYEGIRVALKNKNKTSNGFKWQYI